MEKLKHRFQKFKDGLHIGGMVIFSLAEFLASVLLLFPVMDCATILREANSLRDLAAWGALYVAAMLCGATNLLIRDVLYNLFGIYENFHIYRHGFTPSQLPEGLGVFHPQGFGDDIDTVCERLRHQRYEVHSTFTFTGKKAMRDQTSWNRKRTTATPPENYLVRKLICIHNHPSQGLFSKDTSSFSGADLTVLNFTRSSMEIVVGEHFDYILIPYDRWMDHQEAADYWQTEAKKRDYLYAYQWCKLDQAADSAVSESVSEYVSHRVMFKIAREFDYYYQRFPAGERTVSEEIAYALEESAQYFEYISRFR